MKKRVEYIDIMRGLAMLLVLLGHSSSMDSINKTLLTFHMPLFFFVSGLCFSCRVGGGYKAFVISKLHTIFVPQITLGIISVVVGVLFNVFIFSRDTLLSFDYVKCFSQWFLIALFLMYAVLWWIVKLVPNRRWLIVVTGAICALFLLTSWNEVCYLQQTICALFFGLTGYLLRPIIDEYNEKPLLIKGAGFATLMVISVIANKQDLPVLMYINQYGDKINFLIVAILGIISITDISCCLKYQRFIQWIGINSISVYITHFSLLYIFRGLFSRLPDPLLIYSNSFFLFLLVLAVEVITIQLINKYCPQIIGKKKNESTIS